MKTVSTVALFAATLAGVLQGALSLVCERSYDGSPVDRPQECQPWSPVCKSTGYCDMCDGSFASGQSLPCAREVPYCQTSNGRCKPCTSDAQCLSTAYPTCDSVSGACTEYVSTNAPTPSPYAVDNILDHHNGYRCMHDADDLTYSAALEADAKSYADTLTSATNCGEILHDDNLLDSLGQGENLSTCQWIVLDVNDCDSGSGVTKAWYDEVAFYVPGPTGDTSDPNEDIGHFTQVVWKDTTQLGCALATCEIPYTGPATEYQGQAWKVNTVVCRYTTRGNIQEQYLENVEPVASTCPSG